MADKIVSSRALDLTGQVFGKLTVLERAGSTKSGKALWLCLCECGKQTRSNGVDLRLGKINTCGCSRGEAHGLSRSSDGRLTKEWSTWQGMKQRCHNEKDIRFADYGGRGIKVCARWNDSFEAFLEDMGPPPSPKHSIDRIDVNGDYSPENCRWATPLEQGRNTRRNVMVSLGGRMVSLSEACEKLDLPYGTISMRILRGWTAERALSEPLRRR
jgi:hypothetical protein